MSETQVWRACMSGNCRCGYIHQQTEHGEVFALKVIGKGDNVDPWLPEQKRADLIRRVPALLNAAEAIPTETLEAGVVVVPVDVVEALTLLANGCHEHPSYRAKRKVFTLCERCNAMWEARQTLSRLQQNGGEG